MIKKIINTSILLFLLVSSAYSQKSVSIAPDSGCNMYADFIFKDSSASVNDFTFFFKAVHYKPVDGETIQYEWRFPDLSIVMDSMALHTFSEEGYYEIFLLLTSDSGCADSVRRKVPIYKELKAPNVFSPNNDGINDYFEVTTQGDYLYNFRVFTRTGTQVYYSRSTKIVWDGRTIGSREVPEGVYYFVIESDDTPMETRFTGFLHLFR